MPPVIVDSEEAPTSEESGSVFRLVVGESLPASPELVKIAPGSASRRNNAPSSATSSRMVKTILSSLSTASVRITPVPLYISSSSRSWQSDAFEGGKAGGKVPVAVVPLSEEAGPNKSRYP